MTEQKASIRGTVNNKGGIITVGSCSVQILWLKQQLSDFDLKLSNVPLRCDNTNAILKIMCNILELSILKINITSSQII